MTKHFGKVLEVVFDMENKRKIIYKRWKVAEQIKLIKVFTARDFFLILHIKSYLKNLFKVLRHEIPNGHKLGAAS